MPMLVST